MANKYPNSNNFHHKVEPSPYSFDNEVKILSYCMRFPNEVNTFQSEHFLDEKHKGIHMTMLEAYQDMSVEFDANQLVRKIAIKFPNLEIDQPYLEDIYMSYDTFTQNNIIMARNYLKDDYIKHKINTELLNQVLDITNVATIIDQKKLKNVITRLYNNLESEESSVETDLLTASKMKERYAKSLDSREERKTQKTYGFSCLDQAHPRPAGVGEITIFAGESGSGKSILVQAIESKLIDKKVCVLKVSLEMGFDSNMDRYMSLKHGFNVDDIQFKIKNERLMQSLRAKAEEIGKMVNYIFTEQPTVSFTTLEKYIVSARNEFHKEGVLPEDEYFVVVIDLLSMIQGWGTEPKDIEISMNTLHRIAKKHKIHVIGVVQTNENIFRSNTRVFKKPEELEHYKLTLKDIKNGSTYKERARLVFILNRPLQLKKRFFPEMAELWEGEPDLIMADLAKSNESDLRRIKFNFDYAKRYHISEYREPME